VLIHEAIAEMFEKFTSVIYSTLFDKEKEIKCLVMIIMNIYKSYHGVGQTGV
jgi:hypothetical protein